ncbi:MAG: TRAP transporter small permease [Alphaproteobacteria bacterium]|nr:MAG: TRAP transporter small permease [Alphaproteobacteria bacterium]
MPARPGSYRWFDRQLGRLAGLFALAGSLAVAGLMLITVVAVIWRYFLNRPIFGIEDISVVTLTVMAAGAVAYGARHRAHVSVDVISHFAGRRIRRLTDLVMRLLALGILALATYALFDKACGAEKACITANFSIAHRPFYYGLGLAFGFYALQMLFELIGGILHFTGSDPHELRY